MLRLNVIVLIATHILLPGRVCATHPAPPSPTAAAASFKFVSAEVTLSARSVAGAPTTRLLLEGTQLPPGNLEPSGFADIASNPSDAGFEVAATDAGKATRHWPITITFKGGTRPAEGIRYVTFKYGDTTFALSYKLSEDKTQALDWSVSPLLLDSELGPDDRFPIWIATKDIAASNVRLVRHSVHSEPGQKLVLGPWSLCDGPNADAKCVDVAPNTTRTPFAIEANSAKNFWIKFPVNSLVGKYAGSFWIAADQATTGTSVAVTLYESASWRPLLGLFILTISVIFAWIFGVFLRARANRLQLKRPFSVLRAQQEALATQFTSLDAKIRPAANTFSVQLAALMDSSSTESLEDVLGSRFPLAFATASQLSDNYKARLDRLSNKTALLKMLMESGLLMVNRTPDNPRAGTVAGEIGALSVADAADASTPGKITTSLGKLDEDEINRVMLRLDQMQFTADDKTAVHRLVRRSKIQIPEPTTRTIDVSLESLSFLAWSVLALGSVALGWYVLILNHPGFGTCSDLFLCAAWGSGLPAGATGLASATTTTVATALKIGV